MGLLRLTTLPRFRYPIFALLLGTALFSLGVGALLLASCHPVGAQWDADLGSCPSRPLAAELSYAFTGLMVCLDWSCAGVPYLLLRDLQMPMRLKVSLLALLAFGSLSGVCALIRVPYLKYYNSATKDQMCEFTLTNFPCSSIYISARVIDHGPIFLTSAVKITSAT